MNPHTILLLSIHYNSNTMNPMYKCVLAPLRVNHGSVSEPWFGEGIFWASTPPCRFEKQIAIPRSIFVPFIFSFLASLLTIIFIDVGWGGGESSPVSSDAGRRWTSDDFSRHEESHCLRYTRWDAEQSCSGLIPWGYLHQTIKRFYAKSLPFPPSQPSVSIPRGFHLHTIRVLVSHCRSSKSSEGHP